MGLLSALLPSKKYSEKREQPEPEPRPEPEPQVTMSNPEGDYKTAQSTVNRLRKRGQYDYATVHSLIDACPVLHVSFNAPSVGSGDDDEPPCPVILPMLGATGSYSDPDADPAAGPRYIYLHGHSASRLTKASGGDDGFPVCVAATFMDGLVLAYAAFHNSCNYRSAVAFGRATVVTDEAERLWALALITNNMMPGRWEDGRTEPTRAELTSTGVLKVEVTGASAKLRTGTSTEDRADLKNDSLTASTWTGVLPASMQWGTPVPSPHNKPAKVPDYIVRHIAADNKHAAAYSLDAIKQTGK